MSESTKTKQYLPWCECQLYYPYVWCVTVHKNRMGGKDKKKERRYH